MSYLRFQSSWRDRTYRHRLGVFYAAGTLVDSSDLSAPLRQPLADAIKWFNENLIVPTPTTIPERALFWLRVDAREVVSRIWDLVWILKDEGIGVDLLRTSTPGHIVYADAHQVAAIRDRRVGYRC